MKMTFMILYKKWDDILVPFPFTDLTSFKKRPSLIISPDSFNLNEDIVIAFITSNIILFRELTDFKITDIKSAGLPKPSIIRMKFTTISKSIIIKKLGVLSYKDQLDFQLKTITIFFLKYNNILSK